jgi:hypothetical protein
MNFDKARERSLEYLYDVVNVAGANFCFVAPVPHDITIGSALTPNAYDTNMREPSL